MTRAIFLLLLCSTPLIHYGQTDFNFVPHHQWANYHAMAINAEAIVAVGYHEQCDLPYITYFDRESGQELWCKYRGGYGAFTDVDFAADGSVWVTGWEWESADVIGDEKATLDHFAADGNFISGLASSDDDAHLYWPGVEVLSDGRVMWSNDGYLDFSNPGTIGTNSSLNLNITPIISAALTSTRFAYTDGLTVQIRDEGSQLPMYIYESGNQITGLVANEDDVYWTNRHSLYHYDVETATLSDYFMGALYPVRLSWKGDNVLIYELIDNTAKVWEFSPTTNTFTEQQTWDMPAQRLLQLEWREDGYYQLGIDFYEPYAEDVRFPYHHGFLQRSQQLQTLPAADVGVVEINAQIDSANIGVHDEFWYAGQVYWSGQIEVQNFSAFPVTDSLAIVSVADDGIFCTESRFYQVYPINIPAQSSVVVDFQFRDFEFADRDEQGNYIIDEELCFYTIAPDQRIDLNVSNNMFCERFTIVNSKEVPVQTDALQVFPNPTRDFITITAPSTSFEQLELYDAFGRLIRREQLTDEDTFMVDLSNCPPGAYSLKVATERGYYHERVIVQ